MKKIKKINKIQLLIPKSKKYESKKPILTILIPALNEEITIGEFIDWCWSGIKKSGVSAEIIIVDSSTDNTPSIALKKGARVLRTPKRGLGQAYIDAIPYIRGDFIIMGDCDLTYDFREIKYFVEKYREGFEFIMGSRFLGSIEKGAMPKLHQYFGTPLTTFILNKIYKSSFSDIHCGMRGLTKGALLKIDLTSRGWEYASEMVLKAARSNLRIAEVPVKFFKDREGRQSHLKRSGFLTPWYAGWVNLKVMLTFSPDSFMLKPSIFFVALGLIASVILPVFNIAIGPIFFSTYTLLFGISSIIFGFSLLQVAIIARLAHGLRSGIENFILKNLTYEKGVITGIFLATVGIVLDILFLKSYFDNNFTILKYKYSAIYGLMLIIFGAQIFCFTLLIELKRRINKIV